MEPHREEQPKPEAQKPEARLEPKAKRFRLIKLEERIAPKRGGKGTHNTCGDFTCFGCTFQCNP